MIARITRTFVLAGGLLALPGVSQAADQLKLAVGAPNNWDTCIPEVGQRAGIFAKYGLQLEILYTQGGGETMQAVISGSVDIGAGAGDLYWYVPANSPIKSFKDTDGKTAGYSTTGASTHVTLLALMKHFGTTTKPIATGASAATLTAAMTGQVDVGWASPPFGLQELQDGKIRLIARGNDAPSMVDQTVRVHIVNANALKQKHDVMQRFMDAYRETYEFLYSDPRGVKIFSEYSKVPENLAIQIRDKFMPKAVESPEKVSGLDQIMADAITFKQLSAPLTRAQLADLIQIPPKR
jgi:NitT/TauT family transport system substrate-binding protein